MYLPLGYLGKYSGYKKRHFKYEMWVNRMSEDKLTFEGKVVSTQPRIRLMRSFDERSHSYLGFA